MQGATGKMKFSFYILLGLLVILVKPAISHNYFIDSCYAIVDTLYENSGLFDSVELVLEARRLDITHYKRKRSDKDYSEAILPYYASNNDSIKKQIKVRSRVEYCYSYSDFPPSISEFPNERFNEGRIL
jgi:hypothetical protein